MIEPTTAHDYDERASLAVTTVLLELGQVLGAFRDRFVVIGGSVPFLLFPDAQPPHIGTLDVDLGLDAAALEDDYTHLFAALAGAGYEAGEKRFQFRRTGQVDEGKSIPVIVDLLRPRDVAVRRNRPALTPNVAVQRADGVGMAMTHFVNHEIAGKMPDGRPNRLRLRVAAIPAFLVMKGFALVGRNKQKDAYDIYFAIRNYEGGPQALAQECRALMLDAAAAEAYAHIASKFDGEDSFGPATVRRFLSEHAALGDMTEDQVQVDAFWQVHAWARAMGLR